MRCEVEINSYLIPTSSSYFPPSFLRYLTQRANAYVVDTASPDPLYNDG